MTALTCRVCKRVIPYDPKKPGRPPTMCLAREAEDMSRCARLEKRIREIRGLAEEIVADIQETEGAESEAARRHFQEVKSLVWSELNALTNVARLVGTGRPPYKMTRSGWRRNAVKKNPEET